jgi:uncharacterized protein (TIGR02596 family)
MSLVEILVVAALLAILAAVALPAMGSITQAGNVTRAGQLLGDTIARARQEASSRNRDVEIRLIRLDDGNGQSRLRGVQLWIADESGNYAPLGRILVVPAGIAISDESRLSPILSVDPLVSGETNFGAHGNRSYVGFRIRAGGRPSRTLSITQNFLTVGPITDPSVPPANFYAIRINPATGRITSHRPMP